MRQTKRYSFITLLVLIWGTQTISADKDDKMSKKHDVAEYYEKIVKKYPENIRIDLQTITYENLLNNSDFFKDRYFVVIFHLLFSTMP